MAYATDADLKKLLPNILNWGVTSFADQLQLASDDILERVKTEWWPGAVRYRYGAAYETVDVSSPLFPVLNPAYLNSAALVNVTCYRALEHYIFPLLATDSDNNGDEFTRKEQRYRQFYAEEWQVVMKMPLYDFDKDGQFKDIERRVYVRRRLRRA